MKLSKGQTLYTPITITLETEEEYNSLFEWVNNAIHGYPYPPAKEEREKISVLREFISKINELRKKE